MRSIQAGALPLDQEQTDSLRTAVSGLTPEQLQWVSGYAAGLAAARHQSIPLANYELPAATSESSERRLTVLYGSQTGNGEEIASIPLKLESAPSARMMPRASTTSL